MAQIGYVLSHEQFGPQELLEIGGGVGGQTLAFSAQGLD
jgi:hypothetical protein